MAFTITPSALPVPKKGTFYSVFLIVTAGLVDASIPVTWTVSSGALPAFLTLSKYAESKAGGTSGQFTPTFSIGLVSGRVPNTLDATTFTATITATGTDVQTGTCVSTTLAKVADGPDSQGYHGTEANRTTVTLLDAVDHGPGFSVSDYLLRMWPLTGPSQNS
jgi:hypothetical protein